MRCLLVLLLLSSAAATNAQLTKAELESRLLHKPLYLRGVWRNDRLSFNAVGKLQGISAPTSFTLSGIEILKVKLEPTKLRLEGRRVGLQFENDIAHRVPLTPRKGLLSSPNDEHIRLEIERPQAGDYTLLLDAIFTESLADLMPSMPDEWQTYANTHFVNRTPDADAAQADVGLLKPGGEPALPPPGVLDAGPGVTPPVALTVPEPAYSQAARDFRLAGIVLVGLEIGQQGEPIHVHILRPVGFGLDERAIEAVERYKFQPATLQGKPVVVRLNVEVNFRIF